jgi:acetyl esterase/lipase
MPRPAGDARSPPTRHLRSGVPTELHAYPGAMHRFTGFVGTDLAIELRTDILRALRRAFVHSGGVN